VWGHVAAIYDGAYNNGVAVIDMRHEQAAAHAADAHARLVRDIGVALVTAGPGVTDAVTGVANAYQARSPMVLLGGAAPLKTKGMGALQEMPQTDMFKTFTKASFTIEDTAAIPDMMQEAFRAALSGRPGPVFVELPFDVLMNGVDVPDELPDKIRIDPNIPETDAIRKMFEILRQAKQPVIVAGTQVYWDEGHDALRELTDATNMPVFTNGGGRGTLPMTHPNCFKASRSKALKEADVVILLGTELDFRMKYGKDWREDVKLIQVENDASLLNHNRPADVALDANAKLVLEALQEGLQGADYGAWRDQVRAMEDEKNTNLDEWKQLPDMPINHFRMGGAINEFLDENTILIGDGGDIVSACAKVIDVTLPGQWLDPGPLGCLGVGAPFAIAAQHLYPDKRVLIINGDGSFGLNGFEFDTAIRFNLPIVSIVGNDAGWGQIRVPVENMIGRERAQSTYLAPTRYDKIVEAMGGHGEHVTDPDDLVPALERAFASGKPACINVEIDPQGMPKTGASTPYIV
jgi:acetolactate synthase-1/2/3 large subunit